MFSSTEASKFQWDSKVFVSPIKAPALMILDEYGPEGGIRLCSSVVLAGMVLRHSGGRPPHHKCQQYKRQQSRCPVTAWLWPVTPLFRAPRSEVLEKLG
jgi:hypothetical protein